MAGEQAWVEFRGVFDLVTALTGQTALHGGVQQHRSSCPAALVLFQPGEGMLVKWRGRSMEHCRGAQAGCWSWNSGWFLSITSPPGNCLLVGEFSAGPGNQECAIHPGDPTVCPASAHRSR